MSVRLLGRVGTVVDGRLAAFEKAFTWKTRPTSRWDERSSFVRTGPRPRRLARCCCGGLGLSSGVNPCSSSLDCGYLGSGGGAAKPTSGNAGRCFCPLSTSSPPSRGAQGIPGDSRAGTRRDSREGEACSSLAFSKGETEEVETLRSWPRQERRFHWEWVRQLVRVTPHCLHSIASNSKASVDNSPTVLIFAGYRFIIQGHIFVQLLHLIGRGETRDPTHFRQHLGGICTERFIHFLAQNSAGELSAVLWRQKLLCKFLLEILSCVKKVSVAIRVHLS